MQVSERRREPSSGLQSGGASIVWLRHAPRPAPVNLFHALRRFSRLRKCERHRTFVQQQKRCLRKAVSSMALIQTDRDNVVRLTNSLPSPALIRLIALGFARQITHLARRYFCFGLSGTGLAGWHEGSARRRVRTRLDHG